MSFFQNTNQEINNMDPFKKSLEQQERIKQGEKEFDEQFLPQINNLTNGDKEFLSKIRGKFLLNGGNIQLSIENTVNEMELSPSEKDELKEILFSQISLNSKEETKEKQGIGENNTEGEKNGVTEDINDNKKSEKKENNTKKENTNDETKKEGEKINGETNEVPQAGSNEEKKEFVLLERFRKENKITQDEFEIITKGEKSKEGWKDGLKNIKNSEIKKELTHLFENIGEEQNVEKSEGNREKRKKEFINDFSTIHKERTGKELNLEKDIIMKIIAENYTKIQQKDGSYDTDQNFSMAVKLAHSEILDNFPSINRDLVGYKKAFQDIQSGKHEDEYKGLMYMYQATSVCHGGANQKEYTQSQQNELSQEQGKQKYTQRTQELLKKHTANSQQKIQKMRETQEKARILEEQEREAQNTGEVLAESPNESIPFHLNSSRG